jgi:uncharacterized Zn-binding protein involved in type VI secretion/tetratricopeptide (TPR) repeat protein
LIKPAARLTDMHVCPMVTGIIPHVGGPIAGPGCPTVLIGGLPAARVSDLGVCVGPPDLVALGSVGVFIGGMPAARMGDMTAHGGSIVLGCPTVLIGDGGGGGGGGRGGAAGGGGNSGGGGPAPSAAEASPPVKKVTQTAREKRAANKASKRAAVKAANEALWKAHPELKGRQLTMGPKDAALRKEWMASYHSALGGGDGQAKAGFHQAQSASMAHVGLLERLRVNIARTASEPPDMRVAQTAQPGPIPASSQSQAIKNFGEDVAANFILGWTQDFVLNHFAARIAKSIEKGTNHIPLLAGTIAMLLGDGAAAEAHLRQGLALAPGDYDATVGLAAALAERGEAGPARPLLTQAAGAAPERFEAPLLLAALAFAGGDQAALEHWTRAGLGAAPWHPGLLFFLGCLAAGAGNGDGAEAVFGASVALNPLQQASQFALARVLLERREFARAGVHLRNAVRIAPKTAQGKAAAMLLQRLAVA